MSEPIEPYTRKEELYSNILGSNYPVEPFTREEEYLDAISKNVGIKHFVVCGTTSATGTIVAREYDDYIMLFASYVVESVATVILRRGDKNFTVYQVTQNGLVPLANTEIEFDLYCVKGV